MTSLVIGASSVTQLDDNAAALDHLDLTEDELAEINRHATDADINLWSRSSSA
jgi:L-glyceraldehyde 3-phosphate reductase